MFVVGVGVVGVGVVGVSFLMRLRRVRVRFRNLKRIIARPK
jgi:hypothetical protein